MICQEFGGEIIVNSQINKGTNFTFLFALADSSIIENKKGMRIQNIIKNKHAKLFLPKEENSEENKKQFITNNVIT